MTSFEEWLRGDAAAFGNVAATVDNPPPAAVSDVNEQPPPARAAVQATRTPGRARAMTLIPPAIGAAIILAAAVAWLDYRAAGVAETPADTLPTSPAPAASPPPAITPSPISTADTEALFRAFLAETRSWRERTPAAISVAPPESKPRAVRPHWWHRGRYSGNSRQDSETARLNRAELQ